MILAFVDRRLCTLTFFELTDWNQWRGDDSPSIHARLMIKIEHQLMKRWNTEDFVTRVQRATNIGELPCPSPARIGSDYQNSCPCWSLRDICNVRRESRVVYSPRRGRRGEKNAIHMICSDRTVAIFSSTKAAVFLFPFVRPCPFFSLLLGQCS